MGGAPKAKEHPIEYFGAAAVAAIVSYPLWRVSALGQSGITVTMPLHIAGQRVPQALQSYAYAFAPPYKGMIATVSGMTWARAAIFWGSDYGRDVMRKEGYSEFSATILPPLAVSTFVQVANQPIVRATITIQDPKSQVPNVYQSIKQIYQHNGVQGLWHGTSAGVLKTVPKYCTAIVVKDIMEAWLPQVEEDSPTHESDTLWRSAYKSLAAGVAGAALTNPLDVIRNEMFKTNYPLRKTVKHLYNELGYGFCSRGLAKNMVAVALPVGLTIFFTDAFIEYSTHHRHHQPPVKDGDSSGSLLKEQQRAPTS